MFDAGDFSNTLRLAGYLLEAIVAIGAGIVSGSVSLIGFGIDSMIETSSAFRLVVAFARRRTRRAA